MICQMAAPIVVVATAAPTISSNASSGATSSRPWDRNSRNIFQQTQSSRMPPASVSPMIASN
jgi:hypothetical protein